MIPLMLFVKYRSPFSLCFIFLFHLFRHSISIITVELAESRSRFVPMAHGRCKNVNHLKYTYSTTLKFLNFETSSTGVFAVREACCLQLYLCIYVCMLYTFTSIPLLWFIYLLIITICAVSLASAKHNVYAMLVLFLLS